MKYYTLIYVLLYQFAEETVSYNILIKDNFYIVLYVFVTSSISIEEMRNELYQCATIRCLLMKYVIGS